MIQWRNPRHWRSPKNQILNGAFPDWDSGGGVFSLLAAATNSPPWTEYVSATGLDIAYHGERSGGKFIAPMLYYWLDEDTGELDSGGKTKVVNALLAKYSQKWEHIWTLYSTEYNPLDTYTLTETRTLEHEGENASTDERTPDLTVREVIDEATTDDADNTSTTTFGKVVTKGGTESTTTTHSVQGFNSNTFNNSDQDVASTTRNLTDTDSGTQSVRDVQDVSGTRSADNSTRTTGTDTREVSGTDAYTDEETKTRNGNMYRAPAELLSMDRDFWLEDFFQIIFADVDKMLTLSIYSESTINQLVF